MNGKTRRGTPKVRRVIEKPDAAGPPACAKQETTVLETDGVRVDLFRHRAFLDGQELPLTPTEFRLLECLLRAEGRPCSRSALAAAALKVQQGTAKRVICHVKELRRKLGRPGVISTVIHAGYRLSSGSGLRPERRGIGD